MPDDTIIQPTVSPSPEPIPTVEMVSLVTAAMPEPTMKGLKFMATEDDAKMWESQGKAVRVVKAEAVTPKKVSKDNGGATVDKKAEVGATV